MQIDYRANPAGGSWLGLIANVISLTEDSVIDVAMGFSMACGVIANVALIIRFLEKRVKLMTYVCIVFLVFHGGLCSVQPCYDMAEPGAP